MDPSYIPPNALNPPNHFPPLPSISYNTSPTANPRAPQLDTDLPDAPPLPQNIVFTGPIRSHYTTVVFQLPPPTIQNLNSSSGQTGHRNNNGGLPPGYPNYPPTYPSPVNPNPEQFAYLAGLPRPPPPYPLGTYGNFMSINIGNRLHEFESHEACTLLGNCPLIPRGTPSESRDTLTRNHRSRHTVARNWGYQVETLLEPVKDIMALPDKYAKHLLSQLATLSARVPEPRQAVTWLVDIYLRARRGMEQERIPLRVQDVKNVIEWLDTGRDPAPVTGGRGGRYGNGNGDDDGGEPAATPMTTTIRRSQRETASTTAVVGSANTTGAAGSPPRAEPKRRAEVASAKAVQAAADTEASQPEASQPEASQPEATAAPSIAGPVRVTRAVAGAFELEHQSLPLAPPTRRKRNDKVVAQQPVEEAVDTRCSEVRFGAEVDITFISSGKPRSADVVNIARSYFENQYATLQGHGSDAHVTGRADAGPAAAMPGSSSSGPAGTAPPTTETVTTNMPPPPRRGFDANANNPRPSSDDDYSSSHEESGSEDEADSTYNTNHSHNVSQQQADSTKGENPLSLASSHANPTQS
ncbi:hypothetical protein BDZ91DRAFT_305563 [Kalaharituber pfeilii]|nr:hypothetical protein BDZ91DRAFT_305563 [Kalaharituber pfeilii]